MSWSNNVIEIFDVALRVPPLFVMDSVLNNTLFSAMTRTDLADVNGDVSRGFAIAAAIAVVLSKFVVPDFFVVASGVANVHV